MTTRAGTELDATAVHYDPHNDLAILRVDGLGLPAAGSRPSLRRGTAARRARLPGERPVHAAPPARLGATGTVDQPGLLRPRPDRATDDPVPRPGPERQLRRPGRRRLGPRADDGVRVGQGQGAARRARRPQRRRQPGAAGPASLDRDGAMCCVAHPSPSVVWIEGGIRGFASRAPAAPAAGKAGARVPGFPSGRGVHRQAMDRRHPLGPLGAGSLLRRADPGRPRAVGPPVVAPASRARVGGAGGAKRARRDAGAGLVRAHGSKGKALRPAIRELRAWAQRWNGTHS